LFFSFECKKQISPSAPHPGNIPSDDNEPDSNEEDTVLDITHNSRVTKQNQHQSLSFNK